MWQLSLSQLPVRPTDLETAIDKSVRKMNRPKIKIALDLFDKMVEGVGLLALLFLIGVPVVYYGDLPAAIPGHYGFSGVPDAFIDPATIWFLPALGLVLYIGMTALSRFPHILNYPIEITAENAGRVYRLASKMVRVIKTEIVCMFSYITYSTIQTALGKQSGLGNYLIMIFVVLIFGTIVYFMTSMIRDKSPTAKNA